MTLTDEAASYSMDAQTLQSLRNMGNECEAAADEIQRLRADRDTEEACARLHAGLLREVALALGNEPGDDRSTLPERVRAMRDDVGRLRVALQEADTLLGNDDAETEWREKWDGLWKVELTWRVDEARRMGEQGSEAVEGERLAFEAWMAGHCWALCATWTGKGYIGEGESVSEGRYVCRDAMATRRMWAAWRDRAALARREPPNDKFTGSQRDD